MIKVLKVALSQYNVKEIVGKKDNPVIVQWFKDIGHGWVKDDETAWCSCFINWCCLKAGFERSGKLNARSWLKIGEKQDVPQLGDIVVFWRESKTSWKGHVGLYIRESKNYIYVLGGNQGNKVCIKPYPKSRLLEYRRVSKV